MSRKNKLQKFADLYHLPNVLQNPDVHAPHLIGQGGEARNLRGEWSETHFGNGQPLVLELACGKGEYTLALAQQYPTLNFVGVDLKGNRIWHGATQAVNRGLSNAAFLRTRIEHLGHFFAPAELQAIWITFPDPFLRPSKAERRLTSKRFLDIYRPLMAPGALLHLKTDDPTLYEFTLETIANTPDVRLLYHHPDIYAQPLEYPELAIKTYYEGLHLSIGRTIKYVRFEFIV